VWKDDLRDAGPLEGLARVWLAFRHVHRRQDPRTEEQSFLFELDRVGRRLEEPHAPGAPLNLEQTHAGPPGG